MEYQNMSDKITTTSTYVASGIAFVLSFLDSYAAAFGILIAATTLLMNWWFKWQHLKLAKQRGIPPDGDE